MSYIRIKLDGADEVRAKLEKIASKTVNKIMDDALYEGLLPVLQQSKANAMTMVKGEMGTKLRDNLILLKNRAKRGLRGFRVAISNNGNSDFVHITKKGERQYIPMAIEYGHVKRGAAIDYRFKDIFNRKAARKTRAQEQGGFVAAIPFMRNASDQELKNAPGIMGDVIREGIEREGK